MPLKNTPQLFAGNRAKHSVLAVLTVIMAIFGVKAFYSMQPQHAAAMAPPRSNAASEAPHAAADSDMDKHARESLALWSVLREKRGLEATVAYHFDPTYYNLDPTRQRERDAAADRIIPPVQEKSGGNPTDQQMEKSHEAHIQELAKTLILQTTILGPNPKAQIISANGNSQVVHVGEVIDGFKITAIEGRVVNIQREGVTLGLKMGPE